MFSILLDNATISSVQRALGKAPTEEPALLAIEHGALERFSEAFLLSDNIVVPDTYKASLTSARKKCYLILCFLLKLFLKKKIMTY